MKILVTGSAGFIGSALVEALLNRGDEVAGIDNHNDYYDVTLKEARLKKFHDHPSYTHFKEDIKDKKIIDEIFNIVKPNTVVNLAAQAGVRFSMENPHAYIDSNILGFINILEASKDNEIHHLVYASSSSVYGANTKMPFSITDNVDHPVSLYAATKKSNELMAHSYSHIYGLPTTGLRFFTVYGPWGRPDMALFLFTKSIIEGKTIQVNIYGKHQRDFTYVDDIVEGLVRVIDQPAKSNSNWDSFNPSPSSSNAPWKIYNIGNGKPIELMKYIAAIEESLKIKANIKYAPLQKGDVIATYADTSHLNNDMEYKPKTSIDDGVRFFVDWYKDFYDLS